VPHAILHCFPAGFFVAGRRSARSVLRPAGAVPRFVALAAFARARDVLFLAIGVAVDACDAVVRFGVLDGLTRFDVALGSLGVTRVTAFDRVRPAAAARLALSEATKRANGSLRRPTSPRTLGPDSIARIHASRSRRSSGKQLSR
jgi:hypothetical protein